MFSNLFQRFESKPSFRQSCGLSATYSRNIDQSRNMDDSDHFARINGPWSGYKKSTLLAKKISRKKKLANRKINRYGIEFGNTHKDH
jgi:hypothetical protein